MISTLQIQHLHERTPGEGLRDIVNMGVAIWKSDDCIIGNPTEEQELLA